MEDGIEFHKITNVDANKPESTNTAIPATEPVSSHTPQPQPAAPSEGQQSEQSESDAHKSTPKQHSLDSTRNAGPKTDPTAAAKAGPRPGQIASLSRLPQWPPPGWRVPNASADSDPDAISPSNPHAQPYNRAQDVLEERRKTLDRLRRRPQQADGPGEGPLPIAGQYALEEDRPAPSSDINSTRIMNEKGPQDSDGYV